MSQSSSQETVARLKALLFEHEAREIDALASRLGEMQQRAGSDEQFQSAVARVLDRALRDAEASRHKELADAMAPMVLRTLRTEMKSGQMQDEIAGTLYPRMGEMVSRYVSSAIRDMMQEINRRLEAGLGHNRLVLWLRSIGSGRSMAELALAETQQLDVAEIYLVRRGSGTLVHHWRRPGGSEPADGANRDALVSGFLAAITSFAEEAFEAEKESLRTLELADRRIYVRGSPDYLLAARCAGSAPLGIDRQLDAEMVRVLSENQAIERSTVEAGQPADETTRRRDDLLAASAARIEAAASEQVRAASRGHGAAMLRTLLWIIGLPLAAFVGWYVYVGWTTSDLQRRTDAILAGIPALTGYPVRAHVERGAARIWVTGLAPDEATRHLVLGRLKELAPAAELAEAIGVLPRTDVDARLGVEGLRRSVERAGRRLAVLATDLSAARARAPDAPESAALAGAERTARDVLLAFEAAGQDATSGSLDQPVRRALADLWEIERQLGRLGGASNQVSQRPPSSAVEAAEAIVLVADRMSAEIAGFEQRRAVAPIASSLDAVGERVDMVGRSLESVEERLRARIADLERRLQEARPRPPSPREKLETFARSNAVFFAADAEFRDPRAAAATLDALAALMKETEIGVRIVGYTDEIGAAARNSAIAQSRADTVAEALAARGIPRARLLSVGRTFGVNLAPGAGMDSPNRRVEFELAFPGEKAGSR